MSPAPGRRAFITGVEAHLADPPSAAYDTMFENLVAWLSPSGRLDAVTWINTADLAAVAGNDALDVTMAQLAVSAANQWAYRRRKTAGYVLVDGTGDPILDAEGNEQPESRLVVPSEDARLGTALYAWHTYQQRAAANATTFDAFPEAMVFGGADMGLVRQLLGIGKPVVV